MLVRICFVIPPKTTWSTVWARVEAFASNCLATSGTAIQEGEVICGILTPSFGKHLTAVFNTWIPSTVATWRTEGIGPPVMNSNGEGKTPLLLTQKIDIRKQINKGERGLTFGGRMTLMRIPGLGALPRALVGLGS